MIIRCSQLLVLVALILKVLVMCTCRPIESLYREGSSPHGKYGAIHRVDQRGIIKDGGGRGDDQVIKLLAAGDHILHEGLKRESNYAENDLELQSDITISTSTELDDDAASVVEERVQIMNLMQEEEEVEVSALLVFGDSTVDAGTNKHLLTVSRSDFPPYGRDLASKQPTGRFCNGLLVTDYLASMMGLRAQTKAYLDMITHTNQGFKLFGNQIELEVSFASASSGIYDSTAKHFNALSLSKQLEHFKEYREMLINTIGKKLSMEILSKAVFIVSTGTNDFLNNYLINPYLRTKYNHEEFQDILLDICGSFIKELYGLGARRIGVVSLPPFGCIPAMMTLYMHNHIGCVNHLNQQAFDFNVKLQRNLHIWRGRHIGLYLAYMDSYKVLVNTIHNPQHYGLEHTHKACCGSGKLEVAFFCNKLTIGTCEDATTYAFWDSFHSSDRMNQILAVKLFERLKSDLFIKAIGEYCMELNHTM